MSNWSVYLECDGSPLYANVELDDYIEDEDEAWRYIIESLIMPTLEVTKED